MNMYMYILTISVFLLSLIFLFSIFISKSMMKKLMFSPFECGFNPMVSSRLPFSLQFFLIAILFIIFDIEIILILPMPLMNSVSSTTSISLIISIMILTLGLLYEWLTNSLQWT